MRRSGAILALLLLLGLAALSAAAPGARADALSEVGEAEIFLPLQGTESRQRLVIRLLPQRGIAVVRTIEGEELVLGTFREVSYGVAIPKGPFDGQIDAHFPHLGEIVGTLTPEPGAGIGPSSKVCDGTPPIAAATFQGTIRFHAIGAHRPWAASEAEASIGPQCGPPPQGSNSSKELFGALAEDTGAVLAGPARFRFFARGPSRRRVVEFVAFGNDWPGYGGTFLATDLEWLPGEVATRRVVDLTTKAFAADVGTHAIDGRPHRATFKPPAPFFGRATYLERGGKLRGSLGVRFPGLGLRLAHRPLPGTLEDEDLDRSRE